MNEANETILLCPNCKERLFVKNNLMFCHNNHSFDVSKNNYVNLLVVNKKRSKFPGDSKEMVSARALFLEKGYFEGLADGLFNILKNIKPSGYLIDAGCGTGYFTKQINQLNQYNSYGLDISKFAIMHACKYDKNTQFAVASIFEMPFEQNQFDIILNIFAPKPVEEFARILKSDGIILEVIPNSNHLIELKNLLYENVVIKDAQNKQIENFSLQEEFNITYNKLIDNKDDIINLIKMTPYWHKTNQESLKILDNLKSINVTFDFIIKTWQK